MKSLEKASEIVDAPPPRTASEWARENRDMPKTAPIPGRFNPDLTPYISPVVKAFTNPKYNRVVFVMGTQMGKSANMENIVGWRLDDDPVPTLYVAPTSSLIDSTIEPRFMDMFKQCKSLKSRFDKNKSTKYTKYIGGTKFRFAWAGSTSEIAADSAGLVLVDEVDRIVNTGEGDTTEIIEARGDAYVDSKIGYTATPTHGRVTRSEHPETGVSHWAKTTAKRIGSAVWKLWQDGTRHEWAIPCPHCSEYFIPHSDLLCWPGKGTDDECEPDEALEDAWLACPNNGCVIHDKYRQKMNKKGAAIAPGESINTSGEILGKADTAKSTQFSIWISGLCSFAAKKSYGFLARKLLIALKSGDPEKLLAVYNTGFGEVYSAIGDAPEWEQVYSLRSDYSSGQVPEGFTHLICTVDVQKNRVYYIIRAWRAGMSSRLIEHGELWGDTDKPEVWQSVKELFERSWSGLKIKLAGIDCGYRTDEVLAFVRKHKAVARAMMGFQRLAKPYRMTRVEVDTKGKVRKRGDSRWDFDTTLAKTFVHGRVHWERGQDGDWLLPSDITEEYCKHIVAEELNEETGLFNQISKRNDYLDCEGMQYMCARILRIDRLSIGESKNSSTPEQSSSQENQAESKSRESVSPNEGDGFLDGFSSSSWLDQYSDDYL